MATDIEASLQPGLILRMSPADFVSHLRAVVASAPAGKHDATVAGITSQLQSHVHSNAIPPILFTLWLPMALPVLPQLLKDVLGDNDSNGVRKAGRQELHRAHKKRNWSENGWEALGGIEGIRSLFNNLSASDTYPLVMAIAASARSRGPAGDEAVDYLLAALTDENSGMRQLELNDVARLLLSCSTPFVIKWLQKKPLPSFPLQMVFKSLVANRLDLARNIATGAVKVHPKIRSYLVANLPPKLMWSPVPYKPKYTPVELSPKSLPGTHFCVDLLHSFQDEQMLKAGLSTTSILSLVKIAEEHAIRHKTPFDDILSLLQVGLATATIQVEKLEFDLSSPRSIPRLVELLHYWSIAKYPDYIPNCSINHQKYPLAAPSHPSRPNAKHQAALEKLIVHIIKSVPERYIPTSQISSSISRLFEQLPIQKFAPAAKLPLIKLIYRHISTVQVDLDSPNLTIEEFQRINLDSLIMTTIPSSDSKWLFGRLPDVTAAETLIYFGTTSSQWGRIDADTPWWYTYGQLKMTWEVEDAHPGDSLRETRRLLEKVKREAEKSRDPDARADWASKAANMAIRSKNVGILKDVTAWSSRYKGDYAVYLVIARTLMRAAASHILSCAEFPQNRQPTSLSALKALVDEANSLLLLHIEAALQYLREPSYQASIYHGFGTLLSLVFNERIDGVKSLGRLGLGSESELLAILIEPMMPILTLYDETALADGNEPLQWAIPKGPLGKNSFFKPNRLSALPFLDNVARRRDKLWEKYRIKKNDLVATLGKGWPKGLPIQSLLPDEKWMAQAVANPKAAPFVAERVRNVVFCDSETALAEIPRDTDVIGPYVDSIVVAFRSYVGSGSSAEVLERLQHVWDHYSHVIPAAAEHIEMVKYHLKKIASAAGLHEWLKEDVAPPIPPSLPVSDNNSGADLEPVEWEPWPNGGGDDDDITEIDEVDEKPQIVLMCRFAAPKDVPSVGSWQHTFSKPTKWSPSKAEKPKQITWGYWVGELPTLSLSSRDAIVASAMLYLDTFAAGKNRLLSNQFPAGKLQPRYPPMYLDYEFLSEFGKSGRTRVYVNGAINALRKLKSIVPPLLLRDLANSMLNKLVDGMDSEGTIDVVLESATFKIISLISLTDQPHLASDLGLKVIEKIPSSSSWHRSVVSIGLSRRLSPTQVEKMLRKFSHLIIDSIKRQQESNGAKKADTSPDGDSPPKKTYLKVTTIKLLAELLQKGDLVSCDISLDILQSLFTASNHIDVKVAALSAIIELLGRNVRLGLEPDPKVYKTLVSFSAAAMGPDERSTVTEAEWLAAEKGGPLPKCNNDRPLLSLFLGAKSSIPEKLHEDYVRSVLYKILDESTRQHTRWMRIFLGRFKLSSKNAPTANFGPFIGDYADSLIRQWSDCISKDFLLSSRELSMSYLDCENLAYIDKRLKAMDPTLKETDAGMHWNDYLETRMDYSDAFYRIETLVTSKKLEPRFEDGITLEDAEEEYFQRVAIAAREPRHCPDGTPIVSLKPFEYAVRILLPKTDAGSIPERRRRLLERILADVRDLHSKTWPEGSSKKPPVLPSIWNLRCRLTMTSPLSELAERVNALCEECAQTSFAMNNYEQLVEATGTITTDSRVFLLLKLGETAQNEHETFAGCIKVQLVHHLLLQITSFATDKRGTEIESLLKSWLESSNENIRRIAFSEMERLGSSNANRPVSPFDDYSGSEDEDEW
ncbi:hypothetical protein V490_02022 [Pseudogymnoascus sp. VKM F-3557]|nr:hypothetical protein V490_02022 [Pseudogymnoascus sp. VKM F-3557]